MIVTPNTPLSPKSNDVPCVRSATGTAHHHVISDCESPVAANSPTPKRWNCSAPLPLRRALFAVACFIMLPFSSALADCSIANTLIAPHSRASWVEGGLVYDTTTAQLKTCDGTNWATVGSQWSNGASSAIYFNSGNVGIGTTNPGDVLHVEGASATIRINATSGSSLLKFYRAGSIASQIYDDGSSIVVTSN